MRTQTHPHEQRVLEYVDRPPVIILKTLACRWIGEEEWPILWVNNKATLRTGTKELAEELTHHSIFFDFLAEFGAKDVVAAIVSQSIYLCRSYVALHSQPLS
jgi:hypothetical protein